MAKNTAIDTAIAKTLSEADNLVTKIFNEHITPGLAVGIIHDGKLIYTRSLGYANLETGRQITSDTVFRIMSISKTFTSLAVMQLWEQGKLDLEDPVNRHLRGLQILKKPILTAPRCDDPESAPPVRIRHLLTHTAGIGETRTFLDIKRPVVGLAAKPDSRILSMPEYYSGLLRAEIDPDEKWAYANHAFGVLAYLIECVSGEPFDQYMRAHIFEPLGMFKSDYVLSERVRGELAQGYMWKKNRFDPYPYLRLNTPGCGGIFSTVNEMAKYTAAMMNGGANEHGRVIKPETLKMMMSPHYQTGVFKMGLGFFLEEFAGHLVAEHGGGWPGFISSMRVIPDQKLAAVAFTNCSSDASTYATEELLYRLLGEKSPLEKPKSNPVLQRHENWAELSGYYGPKPGYLTNVRYWGGQNGETRVYVQNGKLMLNGFLKNAKSGIALENNAADNPDSFRGYQGAYPLKVMFGRDAQGRVNRLEMGNYVLYKRPYRQSMQFMLHAGISALAGVIAGFAAAAIARKKNG